MQEKRCIFHTMKNYKINAQDDSFLQKGRWDLENTPKDKFPLVVELSSVNTI